MDPRGFYPKYRTIRRDTGEELDPSTTFTLVPSRDPHAVVALRAYVESIESENQTLACDLREQLIAPNE